MKSITFDTEKANRIENAVCSEFGFSISEIVSYRDAMAKKVVVFLLVKYFGWDKRMIGRKYQMSYLYVPTVVLEMEQMEKVVAVFKVKICLILNQFNNEEILD
jgi:hypothetical protein